uniref:Uncharacterized protein n=1 Tax=Sinocyclocheilus grahami TaxID=75366 RepID=A0A672S3D3_SINGR
RELVFVSLCAGLVCARLITSFDNKALSGELWEMILFSLSISLVLSRLCQCGSCHQKPVFCFVHKIKN